MLIDIQVELVRLSSQQEDALTVLLTGRDNVLFAPLIRRIAVAKKLDLDLICLKPENGPNGQRFASTMDFKRNFLHSLVSTYTDAVEIKVYEDRPKQ